MEFMNLKLISFLMINHCNCVIFTESQILISDSYNYDWLRIVLSNVKSVPNILYTDILCENIFLILTIFHICDFPFLKLHEEMAVSWYLKEKFCPDYMYVWTSWNY
jgi:hypothetical protein